MIFMLSASCLHPVYIPNPEVHTGAGKVYLQDANRKTAVCLDCHTRLEPQTGYRWVGARLGYLCRACAIARIVKAPYGYVWSPVLLHWQAARLAGELSGAELVEKLFGTEVQQ